MSLSLILMPLFSIIVLNLPFRSLMRRLVFPWVIAVCALQILAAAARLLGVFAFPSVSFCMQLAGPDTAGSVVLLAAGLVAAASALTGKALIADRDRYFNFANLLLVTLAGLNGVATVSDIFSLYVFIEVTAVASFILIASNKEKAALQAVFKYIIVSSAASVMMLASIALLLVIGGTTDFVSLRHALSGSPHLALIVLAVTLFISGAFIKGGLVPFHNWLPDVYTCAPAPVSVLLAGAVTKTLGSFVLIRLALSVIRFTGPLAQVVMFVGTLSIVAGALAALTQKDMKRLLAYSSISQMGYIVLGAGTGNLLGIAGALLHLFNHAVFKTTLFIDAAAVESRTQTRVMGDMGGMSGRMPVTAVTSVVSWLSAAGIPPLAGFWSKLLIVVALWSAAQYAYAVIAVIASILTLAYFLLMQRQVFQGVCRDEHAGVTEAGIGILLPACVLSAISIGLGIAFPFLMKTLGL